MATKTATKKNEKKAGKVNVDARETARRIVEKLDGGILSAAAEYREYVQKGGDPWELRKYAKLGTGMWRTLDDVACGRVDVRAVVLPPKLQAVTRRLPVRKQTDILDNGVRVALADGHSVVKLTDMTNRQIRQVFFGGGIRTLVQQRAWLREQEDLKAACPEPKVPFEVKSGLLFVYRPWAFTAEDLKNILLQMESAAR